jgi:hypothetical protein
MGNSVSDHCREIHFFSKIVGNNVPNHFWGKTYIYIANNLGNNVTNHCMLVKTHFYSTDMGTVLLII